MFHKQEPTPNSNAVHPVIWEAGHFIVRDGQGLPNITKIQAIKHLRVMCVAAGVPNSECGLLLLKTFIEWLANINRFDFRQP